MSQNNILDILRSNKKKWFTSKSIVLITSQSPQSTKKSISRIIKFKLVYGVEVKKGKRNKSFIRMP